eukprot:gb/GEZN01027433.1/.p1 GENE.gb/GEZN01027433.1/~~gb/GEZN01027433.1/.p1  ORF type:complete len:129 (+),score=21.48 gb/GEZN01027433.1/:86-472(+)
MEEQQAKHREPPKIKKRSSATPGRDSEDEAKQTDPSDKGVVAIAINAVVIGVTLNTLLQLYANPEGRRTFGVQAYGSNEGDQAGDGGASAQALETAASASEDNVQARLLINWTISHSDCFSVRTTKLW